MTPARREKTEALPPEFPDSDVGPIAGIRVGVGGWTYAPWRKNFYPVGLVQRRELEYASRRLSTIEINGTFYGAQKPAVYAKWAAETPPGFVFSLKAPQHVTQRGALAKAGKGAAGFISGGLAEFGEKLGPILWQMPPSRPFDFDDLATFLDALPPTLDGVALRHALEVRHDSYRDEAFLELARARRITTVFTDSHEYPSFADITGSFVYARLMRSRVDVDTGYPGDDLDAWARLARDWSAGGDPEELPHVAAKQAVDTPRDVFVYFISGAKQRNPAAAMALLQRLSQR
ncbi:MAG: DUF72 domain-containing protein [Lysobacter sp.]